jgi:hypothetical protein
MSSTTVVGHRPEADPALLAFIKCHVHSVATWDALCVLARDIGNWLTQERLERELTMSPARVAAALAELVRDGIIESQTDALGSVYRIPANEPTTIVIERLFNAARVDQNLRRIVVAHMAHGHAPSVARQ